MAKKPKLLSDLFHDTLKDVYFAENKILKTLPKMAKAAQSKDLKAAFVKHERETRGQVKRLQEVFKILGKPARAKTCDAIMGITKEGAEIAVRHSAAKVVEESAENLASRAAALAVHITNDAARAVFRYGSSATGLLSRFGQEAAGALAARCVSGGATPRPPSGRKCSSD